MKVKTAELIGKAPDWAHTTTLPNDASQGQILEVCRQA